jgi:hypothetical protein
MNRTRMMTGALAIAALGCSSGTGQSGREERVGRQAAASSDATITSISPTSGTNLGGTIITIQGSGLVPGVTDFEFGLDPSTPFAPECPTTSQCFYTMPAHAPGIVWLLADSSVAGFVYKYLPAINGLILSPPTMFGGHTVTGTVTLDETANADVTVTLSAEGGSEASLLSFTPNPITIKNGSASQTFTIQGPASFSSAETVTIGTSATGQPSWANTLSLYPGTGVYLSLPAIAALGALTWSGTVTIDAPAPAGASVQLSTNMPSEVTLSPTGSVPLATGSTSVDIQVTAAAGTDFANATVTATYGGEKSTSGLHVFATKPPPSGGCTRSKCQ